MTDRLNKTYSQIHFETPEQPPAIILPWLVASGSLTEQFELLAKQPLLVKPRFEGFRRLDGALSQKLGLDRPQMAWMREVDLFGDDELPWAKAKSVFPITALKGKAKRLRYLGNTPLGYVLFGRHKPHCQRVIQCCHQNGADYYTRQNFYQWYGHRILVQETFSSTFIKRISL